MNEWALWLQRLDVYGALIHVPAGKMLDPAVRVCVRQLGRRARPVNERGWVDFTPGLRYHSDILCLYLILNEHGKWSALSNNTPSSHLISSKAMVPNQILQIFNPNNPELQHMWQKSTWINTISTWELSRERSGASAWTSGSVCFNLIFQKPPPDPKYLLEKASNTWHLQKP